MLNDALAHHQAGRLREAEALYRQLLQAEPANPDALHLLGVAMHQLGRDDEAIALIEKAIATDPSRPDFRNNLGEALRTSGRPVEAEHSYRAALEIAPGFAAAHDNLGLALLAQQRMEDAARSFRVAIELTPGKAEPHNNLAVALYALGRTRESEEARRRALELQPDFPEAHLGLAIVLAEQKRHAEAEQNCRKALALRPAYAGAYSVLGNVLRDLGRPEEAAVAGRQAIALKPDFAEAHNNLAVTLVHLEQYEEAAQNYLRALEIEPGHPQAHLNYGQLCLLLGDYATGWEHYRWRLPLPGPTEWTGAQDLRGKSILLQYEQGLGDTIHFCRYAPLVAEKGAKVYLQVPPVLAPFMKELGEVIADGEPLPETDYACPLLSLPAALETTVETVPATIPYLPSDPGDWRAKLGTGNEKLVGLCWRGNPTYPGDKTRSTRFATVAPLLDLPGVKFVSLQRERLPDELHPKLIHPGADFARTAQLVAALDLVIAVDTVWAHWAGAIGKPVWLMLPRVPHWCWMLEREDSPWYPTTTLFRQEKAGDWTPVVRRIGEKLVL